MKINTTSFLKFSVDANVGKKFRTCANGICTVLHEAGFTSGGKPLTDTTWPGALLRSLPRDGIEFNGAPVEYNIIRTSPLELHDQDVQIMKAEAATLRRHAMRTLDPVLRKLKQRRTAIAFEKRNGRTIATLIIENAENNSASQISSKLLKEPLVKLPPSDKYASDLSLKISESSTVGIALRTVWGPHTIYEIKQPRVEVDRFLRRSLKPFPQKNPSFVTKLKKKFLFSESKVSAIRSQMTASYHDVGQQTEKGIFDMLHVDMPGSPFKYNVVITGDRILIARVNGRNKLADWILSKHVLVSGYDPDVRFAGELWKDAEGNIHFSNNSGTYLPDGELVPPAAGFLSEVFPNIPIIGHTLGK